MVGPILGLESLANPQSRRRGAVSLWLVLRL